MSWDTVISTFKSGTYTVTRTEKGAYVSGRLQPGAQTTFTITASIQPHPGRKINVNADAQYSDQDRAIYTTTKLKTRDAEGPPDTIRIEDEIWEIYHAQRWQDGTETVYRALASFREMANVKGYPRTPLELVLAMGFGNEPTALWLHQEFDGDLIDFQDDFDLEPVGTVLYRQTDPKLTNDFCTYFNNSSDEFRAPSNLTFDIPANTSFGCMSIGRVNDPIVGFNHLMGKRPSATTGQGYSMQISSSDLFRIRMQGATASVDVATADTDINTDQEPFIVLCGYDDDAGLAYTHAMTNETIYSAFSAGFDGSTMTNTVQFDLSKTDNPNQDIFRRLDAFWLGPPAVGLNNAAWVENLYASIGFPLV